MIGKRNVIDNLIGMIEVQSACCKYHFYTYIYHSHPLSTTSKFVIVNRNSREGIMFLLSFMSTKSLQTMMEWCKIAMYMAIYMKEGICLNEGYIFCRVYCIAAYYFRYNSIATKAHLKTVKSMQ